MIVWFRLFFFFSQALTTILSGKKKIAYFVAVYPRAANLLASSVQTATSKNTIATAVQWRI